MAYHCIAIVLYIYAVYMRCIVYAVYMQCTVYICGVYIRFWLNLLLYLYKFA